MDLSVIGATTAPLSNAGIFADNVHDLLGTVSNNLQPSATIVVNSIADQTVQLVVAHMASTLPVVSIIVARSI